MAEFAPHNQKNALISEIANARAEIAASFEGLRREADIKAHLKHSFSSHPVAWLGGAGIAAWLLSRLAARRKNVKVFVDRKNEHKVRNVAEAGILAVIAKVIFNLFKPALVAFATRKLADITGRKRDPVR